MQTVVMAAAVPEPDWMANTSPAPQISAGGNHSNNAITIPVAKLVHVVSFMLCMLKCEDEEYNNMLSGH